MTTDGWTSRAVLNYMSLALHYMLPEFITEHLSLGTIPISGHHTVKNIAKFLIDVIERFGLNEILDEKEVYWITDNASNMKKAIASHPKWTRITCSAHFLQLTVNDRKKKEKIIGKRNVEKDYK